MTGEGNVQTRLQRQDLGTPAATRSGNFGLGLVVMGARSGTVGLAQAKGIWALLPAGITLVAFALGSRN